MNLITNLHPIMEWMLLVLFPVFTLTNANSCEVLDQCSCKDINTGQITSLQEIDRKSSPRFTADDMFSETYKYHYSPCTPFSYKEYKNLLVYQVGGVNTYFDLGEAKMIANRDEKTFKYVGKNTDGNDRTTIVKLICDKQATSPSVAKVQEGPQYTYTITLTSKCACPGQCNYDPNYFKKHTGGTERKRLSTGSILCIVLLVLVILYLVGGGLINTFGRHKSGQEVIPNVTFWKDIPLLIKEGISFTCTQCKQRLCDRTEYQQIK